MQELKHAIHVKELVLGELLRIWTIFTWLTLLWCLGFKLSQIFETSLAAYKNDAHFKSDS